MTETARPKLALFDFDGTLTRADTMFAFVRAARGALALWAGLIALSPWLVAHRVGWLTAEDAKKTFLRWFFAGWSREDLRKRGVAFADDIDRLLRPEAIGRLEWHRAQGHSVSIVSASLDIWVRPWAERRGISVVCTEAAYRDGVFTGELATPNCNGPEKERRIRARFAIDDYAAVYAYGDSSGDAEMLALADEAWFRTFAGLPDAAPTRATPAAPSSSGT